MKKLFATIAAGAILSAGVAFAGTASAETTAGPASASASVLAGARCAGYGWVIVNTASLTVRSGPGVHYDDIVTVRRGHRLSCFPIVVGGPYRACIDAPANGWIPVDRDGNARIDGYVASTCVVDA